MFEQLKREREKFKVSADRIASLTEEYTVLQNKVISVENEKDEI